MAVSWLGWSWLDQVHNQRIILLEARKEEIQEDYNAVVAAKPEPKKYPRGQKASAYESVTKLDMTPTDMGERWLADAKRFKTGLPAEFSGFAGYPVDAKQALTDIAYQ